MKKMNVEKEIKKLESQIEDLIALRKNKVSKNSKNIFTNLFKRENKKEIEKLNNKIDELTKKLALLKTQFSKPNVDLRASVKNELKAYIIQKILNEPKSSVVFKEINTIINEIMKEIGFEKKSKIKSAMKDEMLEKLKENFDFVEKGNINTLESFKN